MKPRAGSINIVTTGRVMHHPIAWPPRCFKLSRRWTRRGCKSRYGEPSSLRAPLLDEIGEGSSGRSDAELAMNVARYDRAAAAAVLAARSVPIARPTSIAPARVSLRWRWRSSTPPGWSRWSSRCRTRPVSIAGSQERRSAVRGRDPGQTR